MYVHVKSPCPPPGSQGRGSWTGRGGRGGSQRSPALLDHLNVESYPFALLLHDLLNAIDEPVALCDGDFLLSLLCSLLVPGSVEWSPAIICSLALALSCGARDGALDDFLPELLVVARHPEVIGEPRHYFHLEQKSMDQIGN